MIATRTWAFVIGALALAGLLDWATWGLNSQAIRANDLGAAASFSANAPLAFLVLKVGGVASSAAVAFLARGSWLAEHAVAAITVFAAAWWLYGATTNVTWLR
jgi:hypothetical protein